MTDGTEFETRSTWGKENDVLKLDTRFLNHILLGLVGLKKF